MSTTLTPKCFNIKLSIYFTYSQVQETSDMLSIVGFSYQTFHVNGIILNNLFLLLFLRQHARSLSVYAKLPDIHYVVQELFECMELLLPLLPK